MRKEINTRVSRNGVQTVMPKIGIAPRQATQRRRDEHPDETDEHASPPPGMGKLIDKTA